MDYSFLNDLNNEIISKLTNLSIDQIDQLRQELKNIQPWKNW